MEKYDTHDLARRLIGAIEPIADSAVDSKRFENLKEYCDLAEEILHDIYKVAQVSDSQFGSMAKAGEYAKERLNTFGDYLPSNSQEQEPR